MNLESELNKLKIFSIVADASAQIDVEAYAIGGYVRDLLLKRACKDIDFVCVGSGIDLANAVAEKIGGDTEVITFKSFGTAMLRYGDFEVEFVGARKESYRSDSRKPIVETGTLEDDQRRRDFTINALAINLSKEKFGELIDPFDGVKDLRRKIIQTPLEPNITFSDDPLRMLRAIRFATQLNFDIAPDTYQAITENKERINIVSMERVVDELNKIILSKQPSYGFKLLYHCGLLEIVFPEFTELQGVESVGNRAHKDNFYHTLQVLDNVAEYSNDLWLRWAAILHDIAKPATKRFDQRVGWTFHGHEDRGAKMVPYIFRRLKLPLNEKMKFVQKLVRLHLRPIALVKENVTDSAIRRLLFEAGDDVHALMALCRADITSKNEVKVKKYLENFDKVEVKLEEVEEKDRVRNFQPVVSGANIMEAFNLQPGKIVGEIKDELREAILEGIIKNEYEEAYCFMVKVAREKYNIQPIQKEI